METFCDYGGVDSMCVNICILREATKTITDDIDLKKSIFKTILQVWKDNAIWTKKEISI